MGQYIADNGGVDETVLVVRQEENRFQFRMQEFVGKPHDTFELEIGSCSQSPEQEMDVALFAVVGSQAVETIRFHLGFPLEKLPDERQARLDWEHAAFVRIDSDGHDDFVEKGQRSPDDTFMSQGNGVERTGKDGNLLVFHRSLSFAEAQPIFAAKPHR